LDYLTQQHSIDKRKSIPDFINQSSMIQSRDHSENDGSQKCQSAILGQKYLQDLPKKYVTTAGVGSPLIITPQINRTMNKLENKPSQKSFLKHPKKSMAYSPEDRCQMNDDY